MLKDLEKNMQKYADLVVKSGANVKKGQEVVISSPINAAPFTRLVAKSAYDIGAKEVIINWRDEKSSKLKYQYSPMSVFENPPKWLSDRENYYAENGACFISILADDPDIFADIDPKKSAASSLSMYKACKPFYDSLDKNKNAWNIVAVPSPEWAMKIFPKMSQEDAIDALWTAIFKAVRVDTANPILAWEEHKKAFAQKIAMMNLAQFDKLHYKNSIGTDITIGMVKNHIWAGGGATLQDNRYYFPNMPTEEIFCSPDKNRADGVVHSAMPLIHSGKVIDNFAITFENGRVTNYTAEVGYDALKEIIELDEGAHHLGEVALIPNNSPISNMNILFYSTLFDENASCHFALGKSFPECIVDGISMEDDALANLGMNNSATHVDFMLGTADLSITGIKADGTQTILFADGNWAL